MIASGELQHKNGNDEQMAQMEPVNYTNGGGWSNGFQVVPAPNDDDFHVIRPYGGFINMKQIKIPTGFVYHKITIPYYTASSSFRKITHECSKLSDISFMTGDFDDMDHELEIGNYYDVKDDGIGYIYYVPGNLYICISIYKKEVINNYKNGYTYRYDVEYTFFIKLSENNTSLGNYPLTTNGDRNMVISSINIKYKYENKTFNRIYTETLTLDISNVDDNYDEESSSSQIHIYRLLYLIYKFEGDDPYSHYYVQDVYDVISNSKYFDYEYYIILNDNETLKSLLESNVFEFVGGYAKITEYYKYGSGNNSWEKSKIYENDEVLEYYNLNDKNPIITDEGECIIKFNTYNTFKSYCCDITGNNNASEFFNISDIDIDGNTSINNEITRINYEGCFSEYDINNNTQPSNDKVGISQCINAVEHVASAILKYKYFIGENTNHYVIDLSDRGLTRTSIPLQYLKLTNQNEYNIFNEQDIMFGRYASYRNTSQGHVLNYIDKDMFKVNNAKMLIKK